MGLESQQGLAKDLLKLGQGRYTYLQRKKQTSLQELIPNHMWLFFDKWLRLAIDNVLIDVNLYDRFSRHFCEYNTSFYLNLDSMLNPFVGYPM